MGGLESVLLLAINMLSVEAEMGAKNWPRAAATGVGDSGGVLKKSAEELDFNVPDLLLSHPEEATDAELGDEDSGGIPGEERADRDRCCCCRGEDRPDPPRPWGGGSSLKSP